MAGSREDKDKKENPERKKLGEQQPQPIAQPIQPVANANQPAEPDVNIDSSAEQEEKRGIAVEVINKWMGETRKGAAFGASDPGSERWWSVSIGRGGEIKAGKPVFSADNEKPAADPNDPHSKIMSDKELDDALMARPKEELKALRDTPDLVQAPKAAELSESDSSKKILEATKKMADAVKKMSDEPTPREKLSGSDHEKEANHRQGLTSSGAEMKNKQQPEQKEEVRHTTVPKPQR